VHQLPNPADFSEVAKSLFAAFLLSDTRPQQGTPNLYSSLAVLLGVAGNDSRAIVFAGTGTKNSGD
jgi:hypothetical protein